MSLQFNPKRLLILVITLAIFGGGLIYYVKTSDPSESTGPFGLDWIHLHQGFNFLEGLFWWGLGSVFFIKNRTPTPQRIPALLAVISCFLFGLSDFIEIKTGSWFQPWWLLALNLICGTSLIVFGIWYWKVRPTRSSSTQ